MSNIWKLQGSKHSVEFIDWELDDTTFRLLFLFDQIS